MGVFLLYASAKGHAFIDRALYLPQEWTQDRVRCRQARVPESVGFATKGELAQQMLRRALAAGVKADWVVADTVYGYQEMRGWLESQHQKYVLAVPETHTVSRQGEPQPVGLLAALLPAEAWVSLSAGRGSQGPRLSEWAWLQLPYEREGSEGWASWLLIRRSLCDPSERAYYRAWGPASTPLAVLVRVAGSRWPIEEGFEQAKGEVGLDQYARPELDGLVSLHHPRSPGPRLSGGHATPGASPGAKKGASERELSALTVPEIHRLWQAQGEPSWRQALRLHWSRFRRAHQAIAKRCHVTRRARQHPLPSQHAVEPIPLAGLQALTPERWEQLGPLLPQQATTGRPAVEHRLIVEGILWVMQTGSAWRDLPERFGPWQTVASRYQRWRKEGRWARILQVLQRPEVPITSSA